MKRIGIITALQPEAACLTTTAPVPETITALDDHTALLVCGMGAERAKRAALQMVDAGMEILISWGTAGALADDIQPGDLIVPETIVSHTGHVYQTAKYLRSSMLDKLIDCPGNIFLGQLADSIYVLTSVVDKAATRAQGDALAVDMESAAIAEVAAKHEIQYVAIRAISDSAVMRLPDDVINFTNAYGQVQVTKLISSLLKRPGQIFDLFKLARGFMAAKKTLKWIGQRQAEILHHH